MKLNKIFFFITTFYSFSFSQFKDISSDFNRFLKTCEDVFISPAHWKQTDWLIFSGSVVATAGTFLADKHARIFSKTSFGDQLFSIDNAFNFTGPALGIVVIYGYGLLFEDPKI